MFQKIKQSINIVDACERYGIQLNRSNKAKCPFHEENTASFSVSQQKQIFHCFGCGEGGDVITLVSKIYNLSPLDACKKLNDDFRLGVTDKPTKKGIDRRKNIQAFKAWEKYTCYILTEWHRKRFLEGYDTDYQDYLLELLSWDPIEFFKKYGHIAKPNYEEFFFDLPLGIYEKVVLNFDRPRSSR